MRQNVAVGEKHFCASAWILSRTKPVKVLLLHHKKLGKWLQPGGHIEWNENPLETVIREVKEETGITIADYIAKAEVIDTDGAFLPIPQFFMEQTIPAYKEEPMHYHLDINYVVKVPMQEVRFLKKESEGIGWFTKEEALALPIHGDTRLIINRLM